MKTIIPYATAKAALTNRMSHPGWYHEWLEANRNLRFALRHRNYERASELADMILRLVGR